MIEHSIELGLLATLLRGLQFRSPYLQRLGQLDGCLLKPLIIKQERPLVALMRQDPSNTL